MLLAGMDEAGLGPALGPLCMGMAVLRVPAAWQADTPWEALAGSVARTAVRGGKRLLIADSKAVHRSRGLAALELGALAFLRQVAPDPAAMHSRDGLLLALGEEGAIPELEACPWFRNAGWVLPAFCQGDELDQAAHNLQNALAVQGAGVAALWARVLPARQLNRLFDQGLNKSELLLGVAAALLARLADAFAGEDILFFGDKQGGRNAYLPLISRAFPGQWIETRAESAERSEYSLSQRGRRLRICFQPRADASAFPVALASMLAKYLRECFMRDFNAYFQDRCPGLAATAGYHGDAPRFMTSVQGVLAAEGIRRCAIWRAR